MRIENEIEHKGFFWLHNKPEEIYPGALSVSIDGSSTIEIFGKISIDILLRDETYLLYGVIEDGKEITAFECRTSGGNTRLGGISNIKLKPQYLLVGIHLANINEERFNGATLSLYGLQEWLLPADVKHVFAPDIINMQHYMLQFTRPDNPANKISENIALKIDLDLSLPEMGHGLTSYTLKCESVIALSFMNCLAIKSIGSAAFKIAMFLSLASGAPLPLKGIRLKYNPAPGEDLSSIKHCDIYYKTIFRVMPDVKAHPAHHIVSYKALSGRFAEIIAKWQELYDKYTIAFNLYFHAIAEKSLYLEAQFLTLVQALEVLHRQSRNETVLDPAEYSLICSRLIGVCDSEESKSWLENKLKYGNEVGLRKRIIDLISPFAKHFGEYKNMKKYINSVVTMRNYFTHFSAENQEHVMGDINALWTINDKLDALFLFNVLKMLGLSESEIDEIISSSYALRQKLVQVQ